MDKDLKRHVSIKCRNREEQLEVGNKIHFQLVGNEDYINNGIILNIDTENEVNMYIYEEAETPEITI